VACCIEFGRWLSAVKPGLSGTQAGLNTAQALSIGELGKSHAQKLIPAREAFDFVVELVS
jgi:hypothetical protein